MLYINSHWLGTEKVCVISPPKTRQLLRIKFGISSFVALHLVLHSSPWDALLQVLFQDLFFVIPDLIRNLIFCRSALLSSPEASTYFRVSNLSCWTCFSISYFSTFGAHLDEGIKNETLNKDISGRRKGIGVSREMCSLDLRPWVKTFQSDRKESFPEERTKWVTKNLVFVVSSIDFETLNKYTSGWQKRE